MAVRSCKALRVYKSSDEVLMIGLGQRLSFPVPRDHIEDEVLDKRHSKP